MEHLSHLPPPWNTKAYHAAYDARSKAGTLLPEDYVNMSALVDQLLNKKTRPPRPKLGACTACGRPDGGRYDPLDTCTQCRFVACESCRCHEVRGNWYCSNSNFGAPYCRITPHSYNKKEWTGEHYHGDRHPLEDFKSHNVRFDPKVFEEAPRKCTGCGKVELCIRWEYRGEVIEGATMFGGGRFGC